jgi:hypothetical protein
VTITSGGSTSEATVTGTGTLTLTVTDSQGSTDVATITVGSTSATTTAPSTAGNNACPTAISVNPVAPTVSEAFSPGTVGTGVTSTLTVTFNNTNAYALTQSQFLYTLPSSLIAGGNGTTTCGGASVSLSADNASIALTGAVIPADGSCSISVPVSSSTVGTYTANIAAGTLTTGPAGSNTATATAALTVTTPTAPTVSESFSPTSVSTNGKSTLTITLANSNSYSLTGAALTDQFPSGLGLTSSSAATTTCGGSITAATTSVALSGGTVPANGSCTISLTVVSAETGTYTNSIAVGALSTGQGAGNTVAASASLTVTASSHGGAFGWLDLTALAGGVLAAARRRRSQRAA